jgi:hypothetical protein
MTTAQLFVLGIIHIHKQKVRKVVTQKEGRMWEETEGEEQWEDGLV